MPPSDMPPYDSDDSDEEDAYDLRDVSSDVEGDPHELDVIGSDARQANISLHFI